MRTLAIAMTIERHSLPVDQFASLFPGRTDVWGALHGEAVKEAVGEAHYFQHLAGHESLGVYPLLPNGQVRWCAIDIDQQDAGLGKAVIDALKSLGLNAGIYLERSKGKGYHVLVFLSDWVAAAQLRRILKVALKIAGLPETTEIFPKQDQLTANTPWGNYLNLPYFGRDNPEGRRMILHLDTLEPMPLLTWLEVVSAFPVTDLSFVCSRLPSNDPLHSTLTEGKTDFQELLSTVHITGSRRPTLASIVGHLRCRAVTEDVAVLLVVPWAREHFNPLLPNAEVEKHIRGIYRRYGVASIPYRRRSTHVTLPTIEV